MDKKPTRFKTLDKIITVALTFLFACFVGVCVTAAVIMKHPVSESNSSEQETSVASKVENVQTVDDTNNVTDDENNAAEIKNLEQFSTVDEKIMDLVSYNTKNESLAHVVEESTTDDNIRALKPVNRLRDQYFRETLKISTIEYKDQLETILAGNNFLGISNGKINERYFWQLAEVFTYGSYDEKDDVEYENILQEAMKKAAVLAYTTSDVVEFQTECNKCNFYKESYINNDTNDITFFFGGNVFVINSENESVHFNGDDVSESYKQGLELLK